MPSGSPQSIRVAAGDVKVTMATMEGDEMVMTVAELLPGAFTQAHMD